MTERKQLDLISFRSRLEQKQGREYWRSLEELAEEEGFQEFLDQEFPRQGAAFDQAVDRRSFLKFMGASVAFAGLTGCMRPPAQQIIPYVQAPEEIVPGKPLFYATTMPFDGGAVGLLVESHMGRPTKVEGNPEHPASLGAAGPFQQASVLGLYDPDRAQTVRKMGEISTWTAFMGEFSTLLRKRAGNGKGLALLTERVVSPTLSAQIQQAMQSLPGMKWHQWDGSSAHNARQGRAAATGSWQDPIFNLDNADVILTIDSDLLASGPGYLRYAREFSRKRKVRKGSRQMSRLYAIETTPTATGSTADHRLPVRPSEMEDVVAAIASGLGVSGGAAAGAGKNAAWIEAMVRDLQAHRGRVLVAAGDHLPPEVHATVHRINQTLGAVGSTLRYAPTAEAIPTDPFASLRELASDMKSGAVEVLVILDANPVYSAPADLDFTDAMAKVPFRVQMSGYYDETAALCHWHIPESHYLESWSDATAWDGTMSIVQPLIEPLYLSRSPHELIGILGGDIDSTPYDLVRKYWKSRAVATEFESWWQKVLHDGVIPASSIGPAPAASAPPQVAPRPSAPARPRPKGGLDIVFRTDPTVFDGRFANNGWLQELPKPLTKLTWDNTAIIGVSTASRLGLRNEDLVELKLQGRTVSAPVWIMPGQPEETVTVHLGYGRTRAGRVAEGTGFNAAAIRTSEAPWFDTGLEIRKLGGKYPLATTQHHQTMEGRDLVRAATFREFLENPSELAESDLPGVEGGDPRDKPSMYPGWTYPGYAWGMSIDTTVCTGCQGCVMACVAENNIAVVGKTEVIRGRHMHWLRIDRYYTGELDNPQTYHQPVPCMQCENAPCEPVCPVEATTHSPEGLNDMTYNRCLGTRYCSNNCPYKVRRFNFFQFQDYKTESFKLGRNPDVTVRERGVMEKCTYCVQRINGAKIEAEKQDRTVRDGEIQTACQQACPTEAITFGDINDPGSRVSALKQEPHHFALLAELNTRPRTTYLASIKNLNPEIQSK